MKLLTALLTALTITAGTTAEAATPAPAHAYGCRSWTTSGYGAAAYCTHLDKGWWMYLQIVCKQKYSTATYVAYTTRTYSPWTTKQKSCASGYYLASHRTITGNY